MKRQSSFVPYGIDNITGAMCQNCGNKFMVLVLGDVFNFVLKNVTQQPFTKELTFNMKNIVCAGTLDLGSLKGNLTLAHDREVIMIHCHDGVLRLAIFVSTANSVFLDIHDEEIAKRVLAFFIKYFPDCSSKN